MGHRLSFVIIFLNAMGFFGCLILIAAFSSQAPELAIQLTRTIQYSSRMFIVGVGLPLIAWEFAASEFDRSNVKVKLIESWATYVLVIVSFALFLAAAWRLPESIIAVLRMSALGR